MLCEIEEGIDVAVMLMQHGGDVMHRLRLVVILAMQPRYR